MYITFIIEMTCIIFLFKLLIYSTFSIEMAFIVQYQYTVDTELNQINVQYGIILQSVQIMLQISDVIGDKHVQTIFKISKAFRMYIYWSYW